MEAYKFNNANAFQMGGQGWVAGNNNVAPYFSQPAVNWPTKTRPGRSAKSQTYVKHDSQVLADLDRGFPVCVSRSGGEAAAPKAFSDQQSGVQSTPPLPWKLLGCGPPPGLELMRVSSPDAKRNLDEVSTGEESGPNEGGILSTDSSEEDAGRNGDTFSYKKNVQFSGIDDVESPSADRDDVHTLMIKHLPCRCTQEEVLSAITEVGFDDLYNFFYLPIRRGHTQNFGYAFVGFGTKELTDQFAEAMTGYRFKGRSSTKACEIAPARIQGLSGNMEHFQKTRCARRRSHPKLSVSV